MSASRPKQAKPQATRLRRTAGRGTLWAIALLLATSGLLRLNGSIGTALAQEVEKMTNHEEAPAAPEPQSCPAESDITAVLNRLKERERQLDAREGVLADRAQALAVAEAEVKENLDALTRAEASLKSTMAMAETAAEDDLSRLTAVYENMKAKEAAALFETMDPQFAAGFLGRMRPEAAAAIMAGLKPETAYTISVVLAGRNANVPTN